eukprot:scaffold247150_cov16-Tisochrysis_lutea.AAC.2
MCACLQVSFSLGLTRVSAGYEPLGEAPPPPLLLTTGLTALNLSLACEYTGLPSPFPPKGRDTPKTGKKLTCARALTQVVMRALMKSARRKGKGRDAGGEAGAGSPECPPIATAEPPLASAAAAATAPAQPAEDAGDTGEAKKSDSGNGSGALQPTWGLTLEATVVGAESGLLLDLCHQQQQQQQRPLHSRKFQDVDAPAQS